VTSSSEKGGRKGELENVASYRCGDAIKKNGSESIKRSTHQAVRNPRSGLFKRKVGPCRESEKGLI